TVDLDPDPAKAKRVAVVEPVQQPKAAPPAPKPITQHVAQPAPAPKPVTQHVAQPAPKSQPVAPPKAQPAHVAKSAALTAAPPPSAEVTGRRMISSRPPCEIVMDGKPTHLMTPQQALPLSPGAHAITLV